MKRLLVATAALSLLAVTAAHAEEHHGGGGGMPHMSGGGAPRMAPAGGGAHFSSRTSMHSSSVRSSTHFSAPTHAGPVPYVAQGQNDHPHTEAAGAASHGVARHLGHSFGAPGFTASSTDRPRYNAQQFPRQINANRHFAWRGGQAWQNQPGFYYRRWGYGQYLPAGWFVAQFWINDFVDYDLPVPPYGYEWIRSGPDALLVDTYSGEVVESVYGVF